MDENSRAAALIESTTPHFNFLDLIRAGRRGGGVAALFKDVFVCKLLSFGTYSSFEYLSVLLNNSAKVILLIIYRPPNYSVTFFAEFAELITVIVTDFDRVIITGDFNIHVDNQNDVQEFLTILENFGLTQHVKEPTHNKGHVRVRVRT